MSKGENIFKRKDGRWEARYIRGYELSGKIRYGFCYGKTYKEAKEKVTKFKAAMTVGSPLPDVGTRHRFALYCDEWLRLRKAKVKEATYIKYDTALEKHIKPKLSGCFPLGLSSGLIDDFTRELLLEEELAPKTVHDILVVLHGVLKFTAPHFPGIFPAIEINYPKCGRKEMRVLSREEQQRFIAYLLTDMDACKFGVLLTLFTGVRIGELCALQWGCISLRDKTIRIAATLQRLRDTDMTGSARTRIVIGEPKSDTSVRTIPMTNYAVTLCGKMRPGSATAYVLTGTEAYMEPRALQYKMEKYTRDCGLEGVHAMKQAVYNFIDNVKKQYSSGSDHRIAIVKFGDSASDVRGWTFVDDNGAASLKSGVQGMQIQKNTGTQAQTGMSRANELINTRYSYSGNNTDRQKVVILFTDGIPGDYDFNPAVADSAASFAKQIKDAGATVYTIGIFNGANVNEMYGSSTQFIHSSGGTIGSHWCYYESGSYYVNGITYAKRSSAVSAAAGNRFLNLVSSNFKNATMCGLDFYSERYGYRSFGYGWKITQNFTRSASNYYLTANDASSLNNIFQTISSNINTPSIELGSETVVRDVIADCFEIPENAAKINVYTAAATAAALNNPNAEASWQARTYDPTISATVSQDGKTVSVSGFNYTDNFVAATGRGENADFYGKKLIIEFTVKARSGFLGGNDVETNASADVYENSSSGTPIKSFNKPTVNVPIKDVTVTVKDKNVYLKGKVTASDLKNDVAVKVGKVAFDLSKDNYGLESWQTKYVNITVEVKDKDGKAISDKLDNLTDDTKYTITVKVSPRNTTPTSTEGETAIEKTGSGSGKINVFKPELTFKDSTAHYGEAVPADFSTTNKVGSENWKHNSTEAVSGEMLGTKPELDVTYAPDGSKFANGTYTDQDVPVSVTVKIGDEVVNSYTTFVHQSCNPDCGWTVPEEKGNPAFLIHIQSYTLTITKTGWETIDENQSFIFKVVGPDNFEKTVAIYKGGSVTINGLKIGTYTVTEVTGWSWRYTPDGNGKTITLQPAQTNEVTFANTRSNDKWLGGDAYSQNKFGS